MPSTLERLKERKLFQWALAYLAGAWLLFQGIEVLAEPWNLSETLQRVVHVLLGIGFVVTLILAWYHGEMGRQRASGVELLILAGILVIAGAAVAALWRGPRGEAASEPPEPSFEVVSEKSIAVLPFTNMSADPENEYFSDGITEEIITKLARISSLQVASRTSVVRFKNSDLDIRDIAMQLGVRYVLEGSVRKARDQVRITAQLIDSETGFHLWAEDFDGSLDDIFDVQESTALQIADALDLRLSPQEQQAVRKRYTENSAAFDAYLRGQALIRFWSDRDTLLASRQQFERALQLEPDYALALAGLASVEAQTYRNIDPSEDRLRRAERLAQRAAELDPELARAHIALGEIAAMRYDYIAAERKFREALAIDPEDAWAWDQLSWALGYQQPPQAVEAEKAAREAIVRQPDFTNAYYHLGRALLLQERQQEAIEAFEHMLELDPNSTTAHFGLSQAYLATSEFGRAEEEVKASMRRGLTPIQIVILSYAYAAQGRTEEALAELERALELDYRDFGALEVSPYLSELREDQRFEELIARYRTAR